MCLAVPAKVLEIRGDKAVLDVLGDKTKAETKLLKPKPGDYVLVQFGAVTEIIDKKAAEDSLKVWKTIIS